MDLDLVSMLPSMESLMDKADLLLRIFVMAGPLALLGLGLYYFLLPPKEANHAAGYRFRYGMSKVGVWRFMQNLAGIIYSSVGLMLTVVMGLTCTTCYNRDITSCVAVYEELIASCQTDDTTSKELINSYINI